MPTPLPAATDFTGAANQAAAKTFITNLRACLAGLFGTDGTIATALATLGARAASDDVNLVAGKKIVFEGATDDAYETTLTVVDPTADRTATLPDADITVAGTNLAQNYTLPQRSGQLTDNDLSFDISAKLNFVCTPTGAGTLTFTGIATQGGQSGFIELVNNANYAIAAHANTKISSGDLTKISLTGRYYLDYRCNGTDVCVSVSGPF